MTPEYLRNVWQTSPDAWVLSDPNGFVLDANPAYLQLYNLTREEVISQPFYIIFPKSMREQAQVQYQEVFSDPAPKGAFETVIPQGETEIVVKSTFSFLSENSRRVAMLSCIRVASAQKQREGLLSYQSRYEKALAQCSQTLLKSPRDGDHRLHLLNEALEYLRLAARADRVYLFENFYDAVVGFCAGIRAEARGPDVPQQLYHPDSQKIPWSIVPENNLTRLSTGRSVGGPIEKTFAGKPETIDWLREVGIYSVLFLPIHFHNQWWGYIGFDDCQALREWDERDIRLLRTAAEIFGSTLARWQMNQEVDTQYRYQQALARCSRVLLHNPPDQNQEQHLLNQALEHLLQAVSASRVYIFRNFYHPENGFCMGMIAEVCAPNVPPQIHNPLNLKYPWDQVPELMHSTLESGRPFGGPVKKAFAATPDLVEVFDNQSVPLRTILQFPIHFGRKWWGFIGFDAVENDREWGEGEIALLQTASEMISSTLQRWEAYASLERRVRERTADLKKSNQQLLNEIEQRRQAETELAYRLDIERVLTTLSGRLLKDDDPQESVLATLRNLGELVDAGRMLFIYLNTQDNLFDTPVLQWHQPGIAPLPKELPFMIKDDLPWMQTQMRQGEYVFWSGAGEIPVPAKTDRLILAEYKIKSLALFPMMDENEVMAVLAGIDLNFNNKKATESLRILQLGTNLVESMLHRERILAMLERRVVERTRELTAIFDITMLGGQAESITDFLEPSIHRLAQASAGQAICIHVWSPERDALEMAVQMGLPDEARENLAHIDASPALSRMLRYTTAQALIGNLENMPYPLLPAFQVAGFESYFGGQLHANKKLVGFLSVYRTKKRTFDMNEISLLMILAEQLGVLIENHRLQQQAEKMAVIGERQRLARELHDSITQSLYSLTLFARAGRYALEDHDREKLDQSLQNLETQATEALKEMRLLLFQLKPFPLEKLSLPAAIEQRFDDVERRLGIQATCHMPILPEFDSQVIFELYRVVMEALNNSLKYAQAKEVRVSMAAENGEVALAIRDDGVGFDVNQVVLGMGIGYMRERVSSIDGVMTIDSSPGKGTQITIQMPVRRQ